MTKPLMTQNLMSQDLGQPKPTVPFDQWNCEQQSAWNARIEKFKHPERFPNGLICPKDGGSLYDTGQEFPGPPPKLRVKCQNPDCGFRGERLKRVIRIND